MSRWPDGQNPWSRLNFDFVSQPRNLKQRLGEANPSRVADFDQLCSNHHHTPQTCSHCSHSDNLRAFHCSDQRWPPPARRLLQGKYSEGTIILRWRVRCMAMLESGSIVWNKQGQDPCSNHCQRLRRSTLNQLRLPGTPIKALQLISKNDTDHTTTLW